MYKYFPQEIAFPEKPLKHSRFKNFLNFKNRRNMYIKRMKIFYYIMIIYFESEVLTPSVRVTKNFNKFSLYYDFIWKLLTNINKEVFRKILKRINMNSSKFEKRYIGTLLRDLRTSNGKKFFKDL